MHLVLMVLSYFDYVVHKWLAEERSHSYGIERCARWQRVAFMR